MMFSSPSLVLTVALASNAVVALTPIQKSYERILVFGASYLDNAHEQPTIYDHRFSGSPDYEGRFGNGPVISEYVALDLGLITNTTNADEDGDGSGWRYINYAYAGAVVSNKFDARTVPDIHQQFRQFGRFVDNGTYPVAFTPAVTPASRQKKRRHGEVPNHKRDGLPPVLVLAEIGLNTMVDIWAFPLNTSDPASIAARDANITSQTNSLKAALRQLSKNTALHTMSPSGTLDILVFGQFSLDKIPNWSLNGGNLTELRREINLWNANLNLTLAKFNENSTVAGDRWLSWSSDNFFDGVIANPSAFNITNTKDACVDFSTNVPCSDPPSFLFWDSVHLTTTSASYLAKNILSTAYVADSSA